MLKLNKVKNTGIIYKLLKIIACPFHNFIFYKKVSYLGRENIPKNKPVIMGPNHQNALMDAAAIICSTTTTYQSFLARSDIFGSDFIGNLLLGLKILPVYRIRDGKDKLSKNAEIFNISVEIIEDNKQLLVYPEAQHTAFRSLLALKKGLMRIAFHTAEKNNFEIDLNIIPVGIYYENYYKYRSKLLVNFGKPIKIKDYKEQYLLNKNAAMVSLKKDMKKEMISLAIHIKNKDYYQLFENSRDLFDYNIAKEENLNLKELINKFNIDKKIIKILDDTLEQKPEKFDDFQKNATNYFDKLDKLKIKDYLFDKPRSFLSNFFVTLFWVIMLPINIAGFVNFSLTVCLPELIVRKFKDPQFHSSIRFVASLFLPLIWSIIGFILLWIYIDIWWIKFAFVIVQIPLFVGWLELRRLTSKILGKWRFIFNSKKIAELKIQRTELLQMFKEF